MNRVTNLLDDAIRLIEDMKTILADGDADAPLAFLEASQDVQHRLSDAVHAALFPLLSGEKGDTHRCEWSDWQPRSDDVGGGYPWRYCLECGRIESDSSEEAET